MYMSDINCIVKEFWDKRPCNIRHSDKDVGTKEYFDEVTKRKYFVEPHIKPFANFEVYKNKDVLEVGCGIGTAAQTFIEHGARYTGIDISPYSIEIAKKRLDIYGLKGDVFEGDIQSLVIPGKKFDLVYSFGVLHHINDLESTLKNIQLMLKPGGEFKLMMYASNSWKNTCIKHGLDQFEACSGVPISNTYTKDEIREILKDFVNIRIDQDHIFQWNIDEYKQYIYKKEPWFKAMPEPLIHALEKDYGWHLLIKCNKLH